MGGVPGRFAGKTGGTPRQGWMDKTRQKKTFQKIDKIQEYQRVKQQRRIFRHVSKYRKFERVLKNSATEICGGLVRVSRKICSKAEPRFVQHRRAVQSITLASKNETARKASHSSQNSSRKSKTLEPRKLFKAY